MKTLLHISLLNIRSAIWLGLVLLCVVSAQSQVLINVNNDLVVQNEKVHIDRNSLDINNRGAAVESVLLEVYSNRYMRNEDLVSSSRSFPLSEGSARYDLPVILSANELSVGKSQSLCFKIVDENTSVQLALYCTELLVNQRSESSRSVSRNISGNVLLEYQDYTTDSLAARLVASSDLQVKVAGLPFDFYGYYSTEKDPYINYDLYDFATRFDVQKWRKEMVDKSQSILEEQTLQEKAKFPEYDNMVNHLEKSKKLLNHKYIQKEMASLDSLKALVAEVDVSSLEYLIDSLQYRLNTAPLDSVSTAKDSLNIQDAIHKLEEKKRTIYRIERVEKTIALKDSCEQYIDKVEGFVSSVQDKKEKLMNSPKELNKVLRDNKLAKRGERFLNYVSEFQVGNIAPSYSDHLLQNSYCRGVMLGFDYGKYSIHGFTGKLRTNTLNPNDSILANINLIGSQLSIQYSENATTSFFYVANVDDATSAVKLPTNVLGMKTDWTLSESQSVVVDAAWAQTEFVTVDDESNIERVNKLVSNLAAKAQYQFANRNKFRMKVSSEFLGPEYFDFNNPFLRNNSFSVNGTADIEIFKGIKLGVNTNYFNGTLWDAFSPTYSRVTQGLRLNAIRESLPAIQYSVNRSNITIPNSEVLSVVHNLNAYKNYSLKSLNMNSVINFSHLDNTTDIDSLNSQLITVVGNQTVKINQILDVSTSLTYSSLSTYAEGKQNDVLLALEFPVRLDKINFSLGGKYIINDEVKELGYNFRMNLNVIEGLDFSINADNLIIYNRLNDLGLPETQVGAFYNLRLNYIF